MNRRGLQDIVRLAEIGVAQSTRLNAFTFELPTTEMIDLYRAADAFVMSSLLEGFSSALLEAMAAALPVIVTDSPGCADFVREEDSGLIVPPRDPSSLAQAMATLYTRMHKEEMNFRRGHLNGQPGSTGRGCWIGIWRSTASLLEPESVHAGLAVGLQHASEAASSNEQSSGKA